MIAVCASKYAHKTYAGTGQHVILTITAAVLNVQMYKNALLDSSLILKLAFVIL
jgi:hypothetical protein